MELHSSISGQAESDMNRRELIEHIEEQDKEIFDLIARVIFCIEIIGWDEEDSFTFPDGETWGRFDPDYDRAKNVNKLEELDNE